MYKILALNCLITAYSLSVQYLDGIKFGDYQVGKPPIVSLVTIFCRRTLADPLLFVDDRLQVTITGMLMSVCFLCISRAKVRFLPVLPIPSVR
jgi:cation-transporting ATPase 13A1